MAIPAGGQPTEIQTGDTVHVRGGQSVDFLTGTFIKTLDPATGAIVYQDSAGVEQTGTLSLGSGGGNYYPIPDSGVTGTGDAIVLTSGQSLSSYTNGLMVYFNSFAANTGAVTIDLDGIGPRRFLGSSGRGTGADLLANAITDADPLIAVYDADFDQFYMIPGHQGTAAQRNIGDAEHEVAVLQSDDSFLASHLAPGGASGDLMIRTSTGKEWRTSNLDDLRVIATYADLPAPSMATEGIFYYIESTKDIFITEPVTEYGVPQLGSFDVITIDPTFLIYDIRPPADFTTSGQTAYAENRRHFYLCNTSAPYRWSQRTPTQTLNAYRSDNSFTVNFIGQYGSDAEALDHIPTINPNTDYFYIDVNGTQNYSGSLKRLDLSSFAAAVTPTVIYEWAYAVDHVRANPDGAPQASLEKLQLGHLIYDFNFGGSAVGLRDEYNVGDTGSGVNTTPTPTQGNVYRVDSHRGVRLIRAACFMENQDAAAREYRIRVYRGTAIDSLNIRFDALVYESDLISVPGNSLNHVLFSAIDEPIEFARDELIYISTSRIGADNQRGDALSSTNTAATSTFAALDTLGITFLGWVRDVEDDRWADGEDEQHAGTESYRQHILYDDALAAGSLDTYGGTTVVANPESPLAQPVLETVNIAGRTLRVQDRISDGDNILEPTYAVAAGNTTIDTSTTEVSGNLFRVHSRAIQVKTGKLWVNPNAAATYRLDLVRLTMVGSTDIQVAEVLEGDEFSVSANTLTELESTWGDGTTDFAADAFFALVALNMDSGEFARVVHGPSTPVETTTSAHGFEFYSRAVSSDQTLAVGENIYLASQSAARCEIVFEIEVARALQISEDGDHIITSPPSIDFIDPLRASLETATNVQVSFQRPYVVNPTESGVLYIMVTNGGSGYTGNPTVTITGGGGSGATASSVHISGIVTRIALMNRGTGYTSVPTVTLTGGGGGSGATARAYFGVFSTIMQDFSDVTETALFATAHFDLERALDETFDGDRICQVSFNVGDQSGMARDYVRSYVPPFPVSDLLALPAVDPASISLGGGFDNERLPALYLNTTQADDPGDPNFLGANGLWLVKLSGGTADQRYVFARGKRLRSIDNVRLELRA